MHRCVCLCILMLRVCDKYADMDKISTSYAIIMFSYIWIYTKNLPGDCHRQQAIGNRQQATGNRQ